jgi:hypothetical protein
MIVGLGPDAAVDIEQEGQNPRVRQENIRRCSAGQSGQRMRAKPQRGFPQSK